MRTKQHIKEFIETFDTCEHDYLKCDMCDHSNIFNYMQDYAYSTSKIKEFGEMIILKLEKNIFTYDLMPKNKHPFSTEYESQFGTFRMKFFINKMKSFSKRK